MLYHPHNKDKTPTLTLKHLTPSHNVHFLIMYKHLVHHVQFIVMSSHSQFATRQK
jgi:hypothetical protein